MLCDSFDFNTLIESRFIATHFQPLVSIKKQSVLGYEALSRGVIPGSDELIPPNLLFSMAGQDQKRLLALDRLCRDKAFEQFTKVHEKEPSAILSLNLDVAVLDQDVVGSDYLRRQVEHWGLSPHNIVIELIESKVTNTNSLISFIETYRKYGFLIALDDIGAGHSNLERLTYIKPEVIKIDRGLITYIDREFYKQEVAKALVNLGQKTGAMVVAEGVEREQEVIFLLELGVDVFQGFYFARPAPWTGESRGCRSQVESVASRFRAYIMQKINAKKQLHATYEAVVQRIVSMLKEAVTPHFDACLVDSIVNHTDLECLYVLDAAGTQVTDTICNPYRIAENKRFIYQPAERGADHSLKSYYLPIDAGLPKYTTEPYISLASGNLCTTISNAFTGCDGERYILCVDISRTGNELLAEA